MSLSHFLKEPSRNVLSCSSQLLKERLRNVTTLSLGDSFEKTNRYCISFSASPSLNRVMNTSSKFIKALQVFILIISLPACYSQNSTPSTSTQGNQIQSDFDVSVRDIYKGYSLIRLNGDPAWSMNLKSYPGSISTVDSISVSGENILAYSPKTYVFHDTLATAAWFVLAPKKKTEKQFLDYNSFKNYMIAKKLVNNLHKVVN